MNASPRAFFKSKLVFAWLPVVVSKPKQVVEGKIVGEIQQHRRAWLEVVVRFQTPVRVLYYDVEHWKNLKALA